MPLHIDTPLLESRALSAHSGRAVWLKMDALQPSGSFKLRGIGAACEVHAGRGARRFVSSSGGNAGISAAHAGRRLGVPVVVVVPETTSQRARELLRLEQAEVIVHGASWQEANELALTMLDEHDAFLHPFDDPLVWEGHATLVDEVARAGLRPDAVVLSVGGGGLLSGVVAGMRRHGWEDVPVVAVETGGAASLHRSLAAGRRVSLEAITSIATSLGAKQVCEQAFRLAREHPLESVVVSDRDAARACLRLLDEQRVLVEPACGAALAVAYDTHPALADCHSVLVVVCGGVTATLPQLQGWAE